MNQTRLLRYRTVMRHAKATFVKDIVRTNQRKVADAILAIINTRQERVDRLRRTVAVAEHYGARVERVLCTRKEDWLQLATIPKATVLVFWATVFLASLSAEILNATFMVKRAGLGFKADSLGALAFSLAAITSPFVYLKYVEHNLTRRGHERFRRAVMWGGLPLIFGNVLLFAWTMGRMHGNVNIFADAEPWPPFWFLLAVQMMSLAFMVTIAAKFISSSLAAFCTYQTRPGAVVVEAATEHSKLDKVADGLEFLRAKALGKLEQLQADLEFFEGECLKEY